MTSSNWPKYSRKESEIISNILLSNKVNYLFGNEGKKFEKNFSKFTNTKYALALANGTLALDLCLRSIEVKEKDEVIVTGRTFIASASCISLLGAKPIFVDVDINSQNLDTNLIEKAITKNTKAIVCVHFSGFPCDMPKIMKLAKKNSLLVIEDCAQAHGAKINNRSVGSFGHINAWSFCNDKIMTTGGEGGMITTNNKNLYKKAASFNNHGKNLKKYYSLTSKSLNSFPYIHDELGLNYRLTEIQSALGNYQLKKMKEWNRLRNRNALYIINKVKDLHLVNFPVIHDKYTHAFYKLYLTINPKYLKVGKNRSHILKSLNQHGVNASFGSSGRVFAEKAFRDARTIPIGLPNSSFLEENSIMLQVHPTISFSDLKKTTSALYKILLNFQK